MTTKSKNKSPAKRGTKSVPTSPQSRKGLSSNPQYINKLALCVFQKNKNEKPGQIVSNNYKLDDCEFFTDVNFSRIKTNRWNVLSSALTALYSEIQNSDIKNPVIMCRRLNMPKSLCNNRD